MRVLKIGPATSVAAVSLALCLLALAPLGWRLGWWHYGFGLYRLFPASAATAAVAIALSAVTLALGRSNLSLGTLAALTISLVVGAGLLYTPLSYVHARRSLPPINDISTDTADRPAFQAALAARTAESKDRTDTHEPRLSQLQKAGYPDIAPVRTTLPAEGAFREALAAAQAMTGWTIVAVDAGAGRIEANHRSRWFGFTDDIVIRVLAEAGGSRIDMRSASRRGSRDYGVNAARIRMYMGVLRKRVA